MHVNGTGPWRVSSPAHVATASTVLEAVSHSLTAVNVGAVEATPHLAMHAAVLSRHGNALVIPGPSGHGKTTLAAALLQAGWDYVSDEALCLRWDDAQVVPYPRPLALSPWASELLGLAGVPAADEVIIRPAAAGARPTPLTPGMSPKVRHVMTLERVDGEAQLVPLHRADGLAALLQRGFTHHRHPAKALVVVAGLIQGAECWRLRLSDPRAAADLVTERLG